MPTLPTPAAPALRCAWGNDVAGDISGDGYTDNADYLIMKANWYGRGDAP